MDKTYQDIHILHRNRDEYIKRCVQIKKICFDSSWSSCIEITVIEEGEERKYYVPIISGLKLVID